MGMKRYRIRVNDQDFKVEVEEINENAEERQPIKNKPAASTAPFVQKAPEKKKPVTGGSSPGEVKAPMSGKILEIKVQPGSEIRKGGVLVILEAMKMENEITANADGRVKEIKISEGASVNPGDILVIME